MNPAASLGRVWAVAALTFKEAVRRKAFALLLLFGIAVISSAAFFPAIDAESRLRLVEVWSVRAALFFTVIVSIFLAGFSLPSDFETRRVYTLVTKPIHRMTLFGGRFVGFFLLLVVFLGLMAVMSVLYIRAISWLSADMPPLRAQPRFFASALEGQGPHRRHQDRVGVRGSDASALVWRFSELDPRDFAGQPIKLTVKANLGRRGQLFAIEGNVRVSLRNPATGAVAHQSVTLHTNQERPFEFDGKLLSGGDRLDLTVTPEEEDLSVDASAQNVVMYGASRNFDLNYFRGMALVLFQSTIVMAVTLAASTYVSSPVSIFLGIAVYVLGMMWGFLDESVREIDLQLQSFRQQLAQGVETAQAPEDLPPWMLQASSAVSRAVLKVVPNFDRFNFADYLLSDNAVMARDLGGGLLETLPPVLVLVAAGLLGMFLRDFAT